VIGGDEDLVGDREGCPHAASTGLQTIELVFEIAAFGAVAKARRKRSTSRSRICSNCLASSG
jgi:hypothetical protein